MFHKLLGGIKSQTARRENRMNLHVCGSGCNNLFSKAVEQNCECFNTQLQRHMSVKRTVSRRWIHSLLIFWPQKLQGDWVRRFWEILKNTFCENKKLEFVPLCSCSFISYMRWKSIHAYTDTHRWHLKRILQPVHYQVECFPLVNQHCFFSLSLFLFYSLFPYQRNTFWVFFPTKTGRG